MVGCQPSWDPRTQIGIWAIDGWPISVGFNPWWDKQFEFEVTVPELALVRFVVEDYDASSKNDFIGQSTIPLNSLKQGESVLGGTGPGILWAEASGPWNMCSK